MVRAECSNKRKGLQANQAGIAVVVALLVLALLSLLGITLMGLSVTESQIGSNEADLKKAFFAAEAGIQEAMYRMRLDPATSSNEGDPPVCSTTSDPVVIGKQGTRTTAWADPTNAAFWRYNPPTCAWTFSKTSPPAVGDGNYFGGTAWNLDSAGRTFTSSTSPGSAHGAGGALINANLTNGGSYTTTVAPVVGFVGGCWQYVDQVGIPLVDPPSCATVAINPVLKVTSTGASRDARKVLSTMIQPFNLNPKPEAPLTANSDVEVTSASAIIDGWDHNCNGDDVHDPDDPDNKPAVAAPPKPPPNETEPDISTNKPDNLVCEAGVGVGLCGKILPEAFFPPTIGELLLGPPYKSAASPKRIKEIDTFNAYLESIKKTPGVDTYPENVGAPFHGILYVDGDYTQPPDGSKGILIVHNATNTANLGNWNSGTFTGVVVADGINKINGLVTIIGAVFGWGTGATVEIDITTGTPQLKWSRCVLDGLNQNFPYLTVKGTWHEQ